jgi:predicted amidohydrolase
MIVSAQWPASRVFHWETLLHARAIENQFFVLASNRCGRDKAIVYGGCSRIVTPTGRIAAVAGDAGPTVIHAVLDRSELDEFRKAIPCLKERRPEVYDV